MNLSHALIGAFAIACVASPAVAYDDTGRIGLYEQPQIVVAQHKRHSREWVGRVDDRAFEGRSSGVSEMIATRVRERMGSQWVGPALRIAKIESGFRCNARNGRAVGVFQNTDPARFGVSRSQALTCSGGVIAGVAHMEMCLRLGASTASEMMRCHNSGSPHGRVDRVYRLALRGR